MDSVPAFSFMSRIAVVWLVQALLVPGGLQWGVMLGERARGGGGVRVLLCVVP